MLIKIQKSENIEEICFTKNILEAAQMKVGDEVQVTIQNGRIIIEGVTRTHKRADLKALLAQMPENYQPEELDWGKPVGKEEW
jgi:antitoxin MazE